MRVTEALLISERLLGFGCLWQTIEFFQIRSRWADNGVWRWRTVREDFANYPAMFRMMLDIFLSERGFSGLLTLRLLSSLWLLVLPPDSLPIAAVFFSTWLIAFRWRGSFNGGSDSMTAITALCLWIAQANRQSAFVMRACLGYIAVQLTISYWIAGLSKLRGTQWREGSALHRYIEMPGYDAPPEWFRRALQNRGFALSATWLVIAFELSFPLAWLDPRVCLFFLAIALLFHLCNFWIFGLNRFLFAWLVSYPALYYWIQSK